MLLEKPGDVRHENAAGNATAIYGVDAHPSKLLFATAGGDGSVKIWALDPQGGGIAAFELLATLSFHEQAVNCVRWAGHGRFLASGSDDQLVLLYELQPGAPPPVPFGSNAKPNKQNWGRCATLKRHTMDIQDLAWSPDDRLLATCSIDNTICIWDVDSTSITPVMNQPLHTLSSHNGWVKGVAWDPVGKYLTSAGEDKTVRVWHVDSFEEVEVISEPFEGYDSFVYSDFSTSLATDAVITRDIPSHNKRELLRTHVLPTMATNRTLQRIVAKYQLMLSDIDRGDAETDGNDTVTEKE
ncbi:hypothetical protein P43SY_003798 [Pythium insidiosum]|uniref:CAF1B/HIR1 beta-propeller domain-containing protein n=1 Tax=Pythium insidiosum TaxID=114742 RepID=A0AAD5M5H1_PYTIN|nr:hypothetical protein P43SY_003798 [Pythium insidiosum]